MASAIKKKKLARCDISLVAHVVEVMTAMKANGTVPDIVEVGNETTNGMLWPDGKLDGKTPEEKDQKWDNYAALVAAGIRGVRSQSPVDQTKILIHIDPEGQVDKEGVLPHHLAEKATR